jgi:hypothetical protein
VIMRCIMARQNLSVLAALSILSLWTPTFGETSGAVAPAGRTAAIKLCEGLPYPVDTDACLKSVRETSYFDPTAVDICANVSRFAGVKTACLRTIADHEFYPKDLEHCRDSTDPYQVISRLKHHRYVLSVLPANSNH